MMKDYVSNVSYICFMIIIDQSVAQRLLLNSLLSLLTWFWPLFVCNPSV